jgi:hypothetical protein
MTSQHKTQGDRHSTFDRRATERHTKPAGTLALAAAPAKSTILDRGSDPYNTSGSFDRKKNWARVGKR